MCALKHIELTNHKVCCSKGDISPKWCGSICLIGGNNLEASDLCSQLNTIA